MKSMKRVLFSPITSIEEYDSPYADPSFMATMDDGEQKHHKRYHTKLNYIEEVSPSYIVSTYSLICFLIFQALIHKFQHYFMACFDVTKMATPKDIKNFFDTQLSRYGQEPWQYDSKKWMIAKSKLKVGVIMWQRRNTPLK